MNLYILSYSTDESDTEEYMELKKCCIGCMVDYTFGDYINFKNTNFEKLCHVIKFFPELNQFFAK